MRILFYLGVLCCTFAFTSCNSNRERYLDLNTGNYVDMKTDSTSGLLVNENTGVPVEIYVDTHTHDTIYGSTGKVVNGHVIHTESGKWIVKEDGDEYKAVNGDEKIKVEGGEVKSKDGNVTRKVEEDGDVKIETGDKTIKIDGKTGEKKVKKDHNITDKIKKAL